MTDPRTPVDELRVIGEELRKITGRLDKLEMPTGTSAYQSVAKMQATLDYLASLQVFADAGEHVFTGTVANDAVFHWFTPSPSECKITGLEIPTGKCLIEAACGEARATPGGSSVAAAVSYELVDSLGAVVIPRNTNRGNLYATSKTGTYLSTGPQPHTIDRVAFPPPYVLTLWDGFWVAAPNTTPCEASFFDNTIRLEVIGDGVPL